MCWIHSSPLGKYCFGIYNFIYGCTTYTTYLMYGRWSKIADGGPRTLRFWSKLSCRLQIFTRQKGWNFFSRLTGSQFHQLDSGLGFIGLIISSLWHSHPCVQSGVGGGVGLPFVTDYTAIHTASAERLSVLWTWRRLWIDWSQIKVVKLIQSTISFKKTYDMIPEKDTHHHNHHHYDQHDHHDNRSSVISHQSSVVSR